MALDDAQMRDGIKRAMGDLGPARRHIERLVGGLMPPSPAVYEEIYRSFQMCSERLAALTIDP